MRLKHLLEAVCKYFILLFGLLTSIVPSNDHLFSLRALFIENRSNFNSLKKMVFLYIVCLPVGNTRVRYFVIIILLQIHYIRMTTDMIKADK